MITTATVSPLWGSEVQPDPGGRHLESTNICHCRGAEMIPTALSGARKYSRAELLGAVWGALKTVTAVVRG